MKYITFWRVVAVLALLGLFGLLFDELEFQGEHIARVEISAIIYENVPRHTMLQEIAKNDNIRAVLVRIDSPGGSASASEEIYEDLRNISSSKPVIAIMGGVAASGGYMVALGADHIIARPTTITGSIGVIFQWFEATALAEKIGVKPYTIRSGKLKAQPSPFEKITPETRRHIEGIVKDTFDWFIHLVARRRMIDRSHLLATIGDGRIVTGQQAVALKLIDALGGENDARTWLAAQHDISPNIPVKDYEPQDLNLNLWERLFTAALAPLGVAFPRTAPIKASDGIQLLWQF